MNYPMRINKYLAHQRIATRDGADVLVSRGDVFINGKRAILGSKVNEGDKVEVRGKQDFKKYIYFAYNKPTGLITSDISVGGLSRDIFPLGRLDKNSHGLIIFTNDGRITDLLLNPKYIHEKEYVVKTSNKLRSSFKQKMEAGVNIDPVRGRGSLRALVASNEIEGYKTKPCKIEIVNNFSFKIVLTEGKKHQIRRMCSALFQEISDLKRIRIINIKLDNLKPNSFREIKGNELETFLKGLGIK